MTDFDPAPEVAREARRAPTAAAREGAVAAPKGSAAFILQLQRSAGNAAVVQTLRDDSEADPHPITKVVGGGGSEMAAPVRHQMEQAFGHDFSDVRVHNDAGASASAQDVGATAATVGNHIVFRSGAYDPSSARGQHLLAHELTHVVQQRSGPVDGTPAAGGIRVSDPSDRFEAAAEDNASHITSQLSAQRSTDGIGGDPAPAGSEGAVQRESESAEGEDEDVQMMRDPSVQRQAEADESETEG